MLVHTTLYGFQGLEPFEVVGTGSLPEPLFDFFKNLNRNRGTDEYFLWEPK